MDKDLIASLDGRFRETSQQLASFRHEIDGRFREASQELASFREETERRFEQTNRRFEKVDDEVRQTRIQVEGLRGDVQLVAKGVAGLDEKLAAHRVEFKEDFKEVKALLRRRMGI